MTWLFSPWILATFWGVWCPKTWHNTQAQALNSTESVVQDNAMQHGVQQSDYLWLTIFPLYLCPVTLFKEEIKSIWHDYLLMNSYWSSGWISENHIGCYLFPSHLLGLKTSLWIVGKKWINRHPEFFISYSPFLKELVSHSTFKNFSHQSFLCSPSKC